MIDESLLYRDPAEFVIQFIRDFVRHSPQNRLPRVDDAPIFDQPLVGFASGDDPLFAEYKESIGSFHLSPLEALERYARLARRRQKLDCVSVISWALPVARKTLDSMKGPRKLPSLPWAMTQTYGAMFNNTLRGWVVRFLLDHGYLAVAPLHLPSYEVYEEGPRGRAANWSEKHIAHAAGLGAFGLHCGLITPRGDAVFLGSVVTSLPLRPNGRTYSTATAYCPFYPHELCTQCMARCPAGAISGQGLSKVKCMQYVRQEVSPLKETYGLESVGCALCFTDVPCERQIPQNDGLVDGL